MIDKTSFQNWWKKPPNPDGKRWKKTKRSINKKLPNLIKKRGGKSKDQLIKNFLNLMRKQERKPEDRTWLLSLKRYAEEELKYVGRKTS